MIALYHIDHNIALQLFQFSSDNIQNACGLLNINKHWIIVNYNYMFIIITEYFTRLSSQYKIRLVVTTVESLRKNKM